MRRDLAAVEELIQDSAGFTALHHAAISNHIQCGILLAEGGASVRTKDSLSRSPLDMALSPVMEKGL